MNTIAELIESLKNEITELENMKPRNGSVVIYTNGQGQRFYGVADGNYNGMAEVGLENIYPQPSINRIKIMGHTEANAKIKELPMIQDGKGDHYFAQKVSLVNYIAILLTCNNRMLTGILEMQKRYNTATE